MAPSIINNDAVQGETFLPGQIFVFGGFALRANSLGHLEQIESYAPGHPRRLDLRWIRATAERAALSRWAWFSSAARQCPGGRT